MKLLSKLSLVTGSTSGIGLGIVHSLAHEGSNILLNGFGKTSEIEDLIDALSIQYNVKVSYHPADMSKPDEIKEMIEFANHNLGGIDILVNNAGIQHLDSVENFPTERWDSIIAINLSSAFHTIRHTLPGMRAKDFGRIINIASVHGLIASEHKAAYVAAKHGLIGLTKVVALETAQSPITCNAVCPGWVLTPLVEQQIKLRAQESSIEFEQAKKELLLEKQPSGEFVTTSQLGALVTFLCSQDATQVRGVAWNMDGGWTAQ
jgi:3-hydroxybutyrate dehydrogenase